MQGFPLRLALAATLLAVGCGEEPKAGRVSEGPLEDMDFAWIPTGTFQMGSPDSEPGRIPDEGPVRLVTVAGYELMTTEVTQGMWESVMGTNPSRSCGEGPRIPVYSVSWDDCQLFLARLNEMDGEHVYRLPTEAEWEYACRAGTDTPYFWGQQISGDYCWYSGNSNQTARFAGSRPANAWGLFDMAGNVSEWCEDWYHPDYSGAPPDGSAWLSPAGTRRVIRGGSWADGEGYCRSANRHDYAPNLSFSNIGFRVARDRR